MNRKARLAVMLRCALLLLLAAACSGESPADRSAEPQGREDQPAADTSSVSEEEKMQAAIKEAMSERDRSRRLDSFIMQTRRRCDHEDAPAIRPPAGPIESTTPHAAKERS